MKVTISADTNVQHIEITRELGFFHLHAKRLETFAGVLDSTIGDVRRAAGLPDDDASGAILHAWRRIVRLVADDVVPPFSPAAVVDRVALLVETEAKRGGVPDA